jgi:GT2 family glycosyltransferase
MLDCALSDPKIALVGPVSNAATWQSVPDVRDSRGGWKVNTLPAGMTPADMAELVHRHSARERPEVPLLNGFCTLMKTAVLEEIGYLDEKSFPTGYGEESDLCVRVARAGYKLVIADDVYVYHSKSASFGSERRRELSKAGNASLLAKHPDTDFQALQGELAEAAPMIRLRKALRQVVGEM